jgi:hypothetical protein
MPDRAKRDEEHQNDNEGGYGGGRDRAEQTPEHAFGDRGWGGGRAPPDERRSSQRDNTEASRDLPEGVHDVGPDDPRWQERYVRENADKYGQAGGQPIRQRGSGSSMGGYEHREESVGSTRDLSPHGTYGVRETERWPGEDELAGEGAKNDKDSGEHV